MKKKKFLIWGLLLCFPNLVLAAPPRHWRQMKSKPPHFKACRILSVDQLKALQKKGAIRQFGRAGVISPTTAKALIVRVQFSGGPSITVSKAQTESFFEELQGYFNENSYGLFTVSATVSNTVYTLSAISSYNAGTDSSLLKLKNDTVAASSDIDYSQFDYVMIYHAGRGQEESGSLSDIWSVFYGVSFTVDGKIFNGFTVVPELSGTNSSPLGVVCHEFGHQLGLPDLYDTTVNGGRSTCGAWSLMDYPYGFDGSGKNPPHLDPWSKNFLKFIDLPSRVTAVAVPDAEMGDVETSQTTGYYKIPIDVAAASEYFISEFRRPDMTRMKFDLTLPTTGIVIWHIDDAVALDPVRLNANTINSDPTHLGVDLVEADRIPTSAPGKAGDAYRQGDTFSSPQSNAYSGSVSGITLANILFADALSTFIIGKIAASEVVSIDKAVNYPNPAGTGYPHPRQGSGVITTIVFEASRPPRDLDLSIYDMAGERIGSAARDQFNLKLSASENYRWVYEYDWNGKNGSGEQVSPGIYFFRIKADDKTRIGKLAIIR